MNAPEDWAHVTQIIRGCFDTYAGVPAGLLQAASLRGRSVHRAVQLLAQDKDGEDFLTNTARPFYEQFLRARDEMKFDWQSEIAVAHPVLEYQGKLDMLMVDRELQVWIVDIKTGTVPLTVGMQTAAYMKAWLTAVPKDTPVPKRACLRLTPSAYKFIPLTDDNDWNTFLSALNIYRFKEKFHGY